MDDEFTASKKGAELLVGLAKLSAISAYEPMVKMNPSLGAAGSVEDWDYFCAIAIVASTMMHLRTESDLLTNEFQVLIGSELNSKFPQGWNAVEDLMKFIERAGTPSFQENDSNELKLQAIHEQLSCGIGSWVLWNLRKTPPEDSDLVVVSHLGRFFHEKLGAEIAALFLEPEAD